LRKVVELQAEELSLLYQEVKEQHAAIRASQGQHDGLMQANELVRAQLWRSEEDRTRLEGLVCQSRSELQTARDRLAEVAGEMEELRHSRVKQLEAEREERHRETTELRAALEASRRVGEDAKIVIESLRTQLTKTTEQLRSCTESIPALEDALHAAEAERNSARLEVDGLRGRLAARLTSELKEQELSQALDEAQGKLRQLQGEATRARIEIESLQGKAALALTRLEKTGAEKEALAREAARAAQELAKARQQAADALEEQARVKARASAAEVEMERALQEVDVLTEARRGAEAEATALRKELAEMRRVLEVTQARCRNLESEKEAVVGEWRQRLDLEKTVAEELRGKVHAGRIEKEEVEKDLARAGQLKEEVESLRLQVEETEKRANEEQSRVLAAVARGDKLEHAARKLKSELHAAKQCLKTSDDSRKDLEAKVDNLTRQLAERQEEARIYRAKTHEYMEVTTALLQEVERIKDDRRQQSGDVETHHANLVKTQALLDGERKQRQKLEQSNSGLRDQLKAETRRCQDLNKALQEAASKIVAYEREVDDARRETQATANQLESLRRMLGHSVGATDAITEVLMRASAHIQKAVTEPARPVQESHPQLLEQALFGSAPSSAAGSLEGFERLSPSPRQQAEPCDVTGSGHAPPPAPQGPPVGREEVGADAGGGRRTGKEALTRLLDRCQRLQTELTRATRVSAKPMPTAEQGSDSGAMALSQDDVVPQARPRGDDPSVRVSATR
jgi:chromosome segregation ATPase